MRYAYNNVGLKKIIKWNLRSSTPSYQRSPVLPGGLSHQHTSPTVPFRHRPCVEAGLSYLWNVDEVISFHRTTIIILVTVCRRKKAPVAKSETLLFLIPRMIWKQISQFFSHKTLTISFYTVGKIKILIFYSECTLSFFC